jgi:4-hydroxy-tetrahydrodipicolinate reductase
MSDMRLVVAGAAGRMGRTLVQIIHATKGAQLVGALEHAGSKALGQDAGVLAGLGEIGVPISGEPLETLVKADGVIDFTGPASTVQLAGLAAQARIVHVIGTTGLSDEDIAKIDAAARHAVVIRSGNMSLGVNLLAGLVKKVAATLGEDYDIEIVEMHHRAKVDAPSGTALMLGEAAAAGRGVALAEHSARGRDGHTGARKDGDIGFASLRGGTVVGDHDAIFAGPGERLVLTHKAEDRGIFARGAVRAALWGRTQKPGHYTMADVLGLSDL